MPQAARGLLQHFHEILFHEFRHCFNAASGKRSVATCYSVASRGSGWSGFNAASGKRSVATVIIYIFSIGLVKFQCRKRQEVCCNIDFVIEQIRRLQVSMPQAARGLLQQYGFVSGGPSNTFQCRKRQEVCCNKGLPERLYRAVHWFQCRKRQEVCCNTVSWKPHEHWPENEVLDNLHEKAPIWHFFRVDTVSFSCEKLASAPAVEGFNVSMICLDNLPPF